MARPTIEQIRNVSEVMTVYQWDLQFASFPKAVASPPSSEDLNLRCYSSSIPKKTNQSITISIRGHSIKVPGPIDEGGNQITLTFIETADMSITKFIKDWREACTETKTGKHNKVEDVKCDILLFLLNRQDEPVWKYKLIGCFLEDYEAGGELTGDPSPETLKPSLIISFDYFEDGSA